MSHDTNHDGGMSAEQVEELRSALNLIWAHAMTSTPARILRATEDAFALLPEPAPTVEPLPTGPCAIRATLDDGRAVDLIGPDSDGDWWTIDRRAYYEPSEITAWEPLLTRAEWLEREAVSDDEVIDRLSANFTYPGNVFDQIRRYGYTLVRAEGQA